MKTSTLFKLVEASAVVITSDGQAFEFEKLAAFRPVDLFVLTILSTPEVR